MNWTKITDEASIRPGGRTYGKYGHILILAGGAGSGKGFAYDMAIDFEGKKFDVDELKKRVMKLKPGSKLDSEFFAKYSKHLSSLDLGNPEDVSDLHVFCIDQGLDKKFQDNLVKAIKDSSEKPNLIFDKTMKSEKDLTQVCDWARMGGYDPNNIHIVWILNDFDVATKQNSMRDRKVSPAVMSATHEGVSKHFKKILETSYNLTETTDGRAMNGDIWIFFNQSGVDNFVKPGVNKGKEMTTINSVRIKKHGEELKDFDTIMDMKVKEYDTDGNVISNDMVTVRDKIIGYVPTTTKDYWKDVDDEEEELVDESKVNESSITRLMKHNDEHDCVCITAYRSNRELDDSGIHKRKARVSNQSANNALGAILRKLGYQITKVVGKYPEENGVGDTKENTWFVVNVNDDPDFVEVCADLAEKDEQDSILVIPRGCFASGRGCYLYGTKNDPDAWVGYHEMKLTDGISVNGDSPFETRISGKKYSFNIVDESEKDVFWNPSSMYGAQARYAYIKNHYGVDLFSK